MQPGHRAEDAVIARLVLLVAALAALGPLGAQPVPLTCNVPVESAVYPGNAVNFTFNADPGEAVAIRVISLSVDTNFTRGLDLTLNQTGVASPVTPRTKTQPGITSSLEYDLTGGGSFTATIKSPALAGSFRIVLVRLSRPCASTLACGTPLAVPIAEKAQVQTVQFTGNTGDKLSLRLIASALPGITPEPGTQFRGYLYDASGVLQVKLVPVAPPEYGFPPQPVALFAGATMGGFQPLDFTVPAAGTYTMVIYEWSNAQRTGNLSLVMTRFNGPCGGKTLPCGATTNGSLTAAMAIDSYTFQASAGDVFAIKLARTDTTGNFYPVAEVYDPTGKLLSPFAVQAGTANLVSAGTLTAAADGVYTVLIRDNAYALPGGYALAAARLNKPCGGQALGCASVTDARLSGVVHFDTYSISAAAGDAYLLRLMRTDATNAGFKPRLEVYDATGNSTQILATSASAATSGIFTTAAGVYTLLVWDGGDGAQSGPYTLAATRLNRPCNATALGCGAAAGGSIDGPLRQGVYSWSAEDKESFTVRLLDTAGALQPAVEVYDAAGKPWGQPLAGSALGVDVPGPAAGGYSILVRAAGAGRGPFGIEVLRTRNACGVTPAQGQTAQGVVSPGAPFLSYSISAAAGDNLLVRSVSQTSGFSAVMDLYGPDGTRLDSGTFGLSRRAAASGAYTLILGAADPRTAGGYAFTWQRLNSPSGAQPLGCGSSVPGLLSATNQFRYYFLEASPDDVMRLVLTRASGGFAPQMELFDPAGARVAFSGTDLTQKLSAGGFYVVMVSPPTATAATGDYVLAYQRPNRPCAAVTLACGQSVLRGVDAAGQVDAYSFTANGGDRMTLRLLTRSGDFGALAEVYDALGGLMITGSGGQLATNIPATGMYNVLVRDLAGTGTGSYRATLQRAYDACPVDDSEPPAITLLRPTGGEVITGGTPFRIAWQSDDNVDIASHEIRYSPDGGKTYPTVVANLGGATQVYDWLPPPSLAPARDARLRVTATDSAGNSLTATSGALAAIGSGFTETVNVTYTYDALNRVTSASYSDNRTIWYAYDAAGNLVDIYISQ
jgi:YD repeat-containing protein